MKRELSDCFRKPLCMKAVTDGGRGIRFMECRLRRCLPNLAAFGVLIFILLASVAASGEPLGPGVLVLSSQSPMFPHSDQEIAGLQSALPEGSRCFVEFLDGGGMGENEAFLDLFSRRLEMKYGARRSFQVIVAMGDDALGWVRTRGMKLFPDLPVVFGDVREFNEELFVGHSVVTGVVEPLAVKESIEVGLQLHPNARRVFLVTDSSPTGRWIRGILQRLGESGEIPAELVFLDSGRGLTLEELFTKLKEIPGDSIVFYSGFLRDREGETLSPRQVLPILSRTLSVPLYVHEGVYVGLGAVGGKVNSGFDHGQSVGRVVARILDGENAARIPVQTGGSPSYAFDFQELKRWSIPLKALPAGSTVINREPSFYERYGGVVWEVLVFLVLQSLVVVYLLANISRRRKAQEALLESEERLRTIYEAANRVAFVMTDSQEPDARITEFSLGAERMFGYTRDEMVGQAVSILYPLETETDPAGRRPILCEDDVGVGVESRLVRKSGHRFAALTSVYPVHDEKTQQTGGLFITFDISELKQAQDAVRESEEKYRLLVENANDAIFIAQDGVIKFPNPMTSSILGYTAEELAAIPFGEHVHPEDREMVIQRHRSRMAGEDVVQNYTFRIINRDKQLLWMHINAVLVQWEGRSATLCFLRDITSEKNLEAQLLRAQKMQAVGTLAGGIAHDFNNLLQAILGYADMLLHKVPEGDRVSHGLQQIVRAAQRGSDLTRQLLTFSRKIESKMEAVDLNRVLEGLYGMLERTLPRMITIDLKLQEGLSHVHADPSQLEQVLMNLTLNARDAMPNGGRLTIETRNVFLGEEYCNLHPEVRPGEYVLLTVSDTGHGMDKETLQRIFDPFFTTKETGKGTGLGLAMVYGIIKNHSGHILCHSELQQGASFKIYLPVSDSPGEQEKTVRESPAAGGHETILLVDDDEAIREVGADILSQYGYSVLTAVDGESALEIYASRKDDIDLILLDMSMPGMGGRECLIRLVEMDPDVRVVIASGYSAHGPVKDAVHLGARNVVTKPYNVSEILGVIRKALE